MRPFYLIAIFVGLTISSLTAQNLLYLEFPNQFKRQEIKPGKEYGWEIDNMEWLTFRLLKVDDSMVHFEDDSLLVSRVTGIKIMRNKRMVGMFVNVFLSIAIYYPAMILINGGFKTFMKRWIEATAVTLASYAAFRFTKRLLWKKIEFDNEKRRLTIRKPI